MRPRCTVLATCSFENTITVAGTLIHHTYGVDEMDTIRFSTVADQVWSQLASNAETLWIPRKVS